MRGLLQMNNLPGTFTQSGWECPRCHRINAPFNFQCFCHESETTTSESGTGGRNHGGSLAGCAHKSDGDSYTFECINGATMCFLRCEKCGEFYR